MKVVEITNQPRGVGARRDQRRIATSGATPDDFARVKAKNSRAGVLNPMARYRKEVSPAEVLASPMVADPLHLLDICATSDGGAAVVLASGDAARRLGIDARVHVRAVSTITPTYPNHLIEMPDFATDAWNVAPPSTSSFRDAIAAGAYEEAGVGPEDVSIAEVYDLSTALEPRTVRAGRCRGIAPVRCDRARRPDPGQQLGRTGLVRRSDPSTGARTGVRARRPTLRALCGPRPATDPRVAITANQGLFGHGSSVILAR